ncbi:MAG TPA: AGE family epimerase/isomerase [Verrucomicrobiae bacterium]|nr:AGE family epimerase/isomerase [Verrucomicrobiae bacterium]
MNSAELKDFSKSVNNELYGDIMPFWCGPALDQKNGGWMSWLSNDLKPDRTQPKGLIITTRLLWTFSAVHRAKNEGIYHEMADRALDFVMNRFWDTKYGGAFWQIDDAGRVTDDTKKIYGEAFYIYALSEYHLAFNSPPALARAKELFELLETHAHDSKNGGYIESCRRDWTEAGPEARISAEDQDAKKSMNTSLHVLEAFANLYRVWKEPRVAARLREMIQIFQKKIIDPKTHHFHSFFDETWKVRSENYTFGHDIEGSWLLCEAAEVLDDEALLKEIRAEALRMAEVTLNEGIEPDGGLCYEGEGGKIIDRGKEWWPQAEAIIGFINAYQLSGDEKILTAARKVWDYIEQHLVDRVHGEWFWRITPEGKVDETKPKVSEWKEPYHASRACLETLHRLKMISTIKA